MKKIILPGLVAGILLLILSEIGLHLTRLIFPGVAAEYFHPAFDTGPDKTALYYLHPFVIGLALAWFWDRFKNILTGAYLTQGLEFGLIYAGVAAFPMMWLIYAAMNVSLAIVATWFVLAILQGIIAGLVFEKMNPHSKPILR